MAKDACGDVAGAEHLHQVRGIAFEVGRVGRHVGNGKEPAQLLHDEVLPGGPPGVHTIRDASSLLSRNRRGDCSGQYTTGQDEPTSSHASLVGDGSGTGNIDALHSMPGTLCVALPDATLTTGYGVAYRTLGAVGTNATMRNGPPLPFSIFMGSATT